LPATVAHTSRWIVGIAMLAGLGGCAHSLVYHEARDKQAQAAKRAAGELKVGDTVRALEKSHADVTALEIDNARTVADALREKELHRVSRARTLRQPSTDEFRKAPGLIDSLEDRMAKLGAKPREDGGINAPPTDARNCGVLDCKALMTIKNTPVSLKEEQASFEQSRALFRANYGYDFRTCAEIDAAKVAKGDEIALSGAFVSQLVASDNRIGLAEVDFKSLVDTCKDIADSRKRFADSLTRSRGGIRDVLNDAARAERDIAAYRTKLVEARAKLDEAIEQFAAEEGALKPSERSVLRELETRASELKAVVNLVKSGADALSNPGSHAVAEVMVVRLDTVLGAITGQASDAAKLSKSDRAAVAFVRTAAELADDADKLLKEAGRPRIAPFVIAREHYRLVVKGLDDTLAIKVRRADALRARADAMTRELGALAQVHYLLTDERRSWEKRAITQIDSPSTPAGERVSLYEALAIYWDEVFLYRSDAELWKTRAQALEFDANLAASAAAAMQWDNLIGGVAQVLADYHASGIKTAEIAEFLKAFGLIYIGVGVAQ
jgi:hypothetical protein